MFPLILQYWEKSRAALINQFKGNKKQCLGWRRKIRLETEDSTAWATAQNMDATQC